MPPHQKEVIRNVVPVRLNRAAMPLALPLNFIADAGTEFNPAFKNFDNLASITGAGTFGNYAFAGLASLRSVRLLSASLGTGAFMGCRNLSEVDIPLTYISQWAFAGCISLTSIIIAPSGNESEMNQIHIFQEAFSGCTSLVSLTIPDTYLIKSRAFKDCTSLVSLYISDPSEPPTFEDDVFYGAARTARTITIYVSPDNFGHYQTLHKYGTNSSTGYFWDKDSLYRDNLTVVLGVIP
jgi:hypothetical protein